MHIEEKHAQRTFAKFVWEVEEMEKERVYREEPLAGRQTHESFERARRSGMRASALSRAGRFADAETPSLLTLSLARRLERDFGPAMVMESLQRLVDLYTQLDRFHDAHAYCRELLDRQRATLGLLHPMTLEPMHTLAVILAREGRFREAPLGRAAERLLALVAQSVEAHVQLGQRRTRVNTDELRH